MHVLASSVHPTISRVEHSDNFDSKHLTAITERPAAPRHTLTIISFGFLWNRAPVIRSSRLGIPLQHASGN
jgi:hypothetical protein